MQAMQDKIKVVIVDDEPQSIHRLQDDLATLVDFEVIATSSSAVSAKNLVMSMQPDVLSSMLKCLDRRAWKYCSL